MQSYAELNDENADILEMQSHAELNDEMTSYDHGVYIREFVPVLQRFDNQTSAPALGPSGQFDMRLLFEPHAPGLETRDIDRYKGLHSRGTC